MQAYGCRKVAFPKPGGVGVLASVVVEKRGDGPDGERCHLPALLKS